MAMKETEGSLKAYFIFAGVIAVAMGLRDNEQASVFGSMLTAGQKAALYVPIVTRIALGIAFVVAGIRLKSALLTGAGWIKTMLLVSGALLLIDGALITAVFGVGPGQSGLTGAVVGIAITAYLYSSVKRLAAEALARAAFAAPLPPTRAI